MLLTIFLFCIGLLLIIKGGDWFVDGATAIAARFHVPEILIGATIVSIGTTIPEVMVSATAAAGGHGEIAYGNAIGSIICNTALIAALTLAIRPGKTDARSFRKPVFFFFAAAAFYLFVAYALGVYTRTIGLILLAGFVLYMVLTVREALRNASVSDPQTEKASSGDGEPSEAAKENPLWQYLLMLVIGAAAIAVGANLLVNKGTLIAEALGVPESVIALTFVALGTSLPELVTAITSLAKGHSDLSIGNVIGANLFNLVLVSGVAITINPYDLPVAKLLAGRNASLVLDLPLMVLVMMLMTLPTFKKGQTHRWQGIVLLTLYAAYCAFQFFF